MHRGGQQSGGGLYRHWQGPVAGYRRWQGWPAVTAVAGNMPQTQRRKSKSGTALRLCVCTWVHMTQFALTFSAETQLYFTATQGNFALQARASGIVSTFKMLGAFLLNPIIAGLSDAHGRKLLLFVPSAADLLQRLVIIPNMSLTGLLISNIGGPFAIAGGSAARVALADLYIDEPVEMAKWTGLMQMSTYVNPDYVYTVCERLQKSSLN
jgi:hypothetical protein